MIESIAEWVIVLLCATPVLHSLYRLVIARRLRQRFDRVRMGNAETGDIFEAIDPPWWNLRRQFLKRKADGVIEFMYPHPLTQNPQYIKIKARHVAHPGDICPLCKRPFKGIRRLP